MKITALERLLNYQTRLQGVANGLAETLRKLIADADDATQKILLSELKLADADVRKKMKRIGEIVEKIEAQRAATFDAARDATVETGRDVAEIATAKTATEIRDALRDDPDLSASLERDRKRRRSEIKNLSKREIDGILKYSPFNGASIRQTFDQWRRNDLRRIVAAVQDGAVNGLSVAEIVKKIRGTKANEYKDGIAQTSKNSATTLARTVINGVSNAARMETLQKNADVLDGIQFLATLDGRTSFICASLDGKIWRGAQMESAPRPPLHPNCRSTIIPYIELRAPETGELLEEPTTRPAANADFNKLAEEEYNKNAKAKGIARRWNDLSASTRKKYYYQAQRDWEAANGGENAYKQVPASTTFKEYFEKQDDAFKRSWLGKQRFELYSNGRLKFEDLSKPAAAFVAKPSDLNVANVDFLRVDGKLVDAVRESGGKEFLFGANRIERNVASVSDDNFLEGFVEQKDVRKAEKFARDVLGVDADYSKIPLDVANATNRELIRARNIFGTCGVVNKIGCGDALFADGDFAGYDRKENKILLRSDYGTMRLATEIRRLHGECCFSTDDKNHVFRHEIGHAILKYLEMSLPQEYNNCMNACRALYESLIKQKNAETLLSKYGLRNVREVVAESVAEAMNGNARETALKFVRTLTECKQ